MGTKLEPREEELYRRIDEVFHYVWGPIRISGIPMARDEYLTCRRSFPCSSLRQVQMTSLRIWNGLRLTEGGSDFAANQHTVEYRKGLHTEACKPLVLYA